MWAVTISFWRIKIYYFISLRGRRKKGRGREKSLPFSLFPYPLSLRRLLRRLLFYRCPFCLYNKKNITRRLEDTNFIFSWQKQYFTHSLRTFVKYCFATRIHIFAPPCNILYIFTFLVWIMTLCDVKVILGTVLLITDGNVTIKFSINSHSSCKKL